MTHQTPTIQTVHDETFVIECNRSSGSVLGAAQTLLKNDGELVTFDNRDDAQKRVDEITAKLMTFNLWYRVIEWNPGLSCE